MVKAVHDELFSCISLVLGGVASRVGGWLSACVIGSVLSSQVLDGLGGVAGWLGVVGSFVEQEALGLIFEGSLLLFGHS